MWYEGIRRSGRPHKREHGPSTLCLVLSRCASARVKPALLEACSLLLAVQDGQTSDRSCCCSSLGSAAMKCWHILKERTWQRLVPTDEGE